MQVDAQFRAVAEGGTKRRLEGEMGPLNARRNGLDFILRLWDHFENFKQGSDGLEKVGGNINMVRSPPVTKCHGPAVFQGVEENRWGVETLVKGVCW